MWLRVHPYSFGVVSYRRPARVAANDPLWVIDYAADMHIYRALLFQHWHIFETYHAQVRVVSKAS
jgi:hypothetical protein